jgi:hypothetical protein
MRLGHALSTLLHRSWLWLLALAVAFPHAAAAQSDVIGSGTGFFINTDGWLVTNAHVLVGCQRATVPALGETSDWVVDKQNDLAAIRVVAAAGKPYLMLRAAPPRLGEDIAAFGHPLHGLLSDSVKVTTGNVNSLVGVENDTRYLQVSTPLQPGNSGGPVVDQNGAVLGVASAVLGSKFTEATGVSPQNVNFAVHANILELFLRSRNILHEKASEADAPLSTADLAERTAPAIVQILCRGTLPSVAAKPAPLPAAPAASQVIRSFQFLDNHDVIGFDYATLKGVTQSDCQSACQRDLSCRATTYNKRERLCFLKNDAKLLVRNEDAYANVASELSSSVAVSRFTIATGRDLAGGDYKRIRGSDFINCRRFDGMGCMEHPTPPPPTSENAPTRSHSDSPPSSPARECRRRNRRTSPMTASRWGRSRRWG